MHQHHAVVLQLWCKKLMPACMMATLIAVITCLQLVLQKAQKKMLDIINSVGLGESVMKMIERRHRADLYLALGGMVSTSACDMQPQLPEHNIFPNSRAVLYWSHTFISI